MINKTVTVKELIKKVLKKKKQKEKMKSNNLKNPRKPLEKMTKKELIAIVLEQNRKLDQVGQVIREIDNKFKRTFLL